MQIPRASAAVPTPSAGPGGFFTPAPEKESATRTEFLKRARMTAAEQMRAQVLDALGLKEEDLAKMSPDARKKVEEKIKEMIKTKVEQAQEKKTGMLVDVVA
jgi:hypothetical protein